MKTTIWGWGGPSVLEVEETQQPGHERHDSHSRKHHKEDAAAAAKLMREWSDVQLKVIPTSCVNGILIPAQGQGLLIVSPANESEYHMVVTPVKVKLCSVDNEQLPS